MKVKKQGQRKLNKVFTYTLLLDLLFKGKYQSAIAKELKWTKQRTNYWVKQLEHEQFIQQETRSSIKTYSITMKGKKFLSWSNARPKFEIFLHHLGLKFPLLESTTDFDHLNWKETHLKNWIKKVLKYEHITGNFSIEQNPTNLIIWCKEYVGTNPYRLFYESIRDTLLFADSLQNKYSVKLGIPQLYRKPHFGINEPIMSKINELIQVTGSEEWSDTTPFPGSVEFFEPQRIIQYLKMPERIECYETIMQEITAQMKTFGEGMKQHMKLISFLHDLTISLNKVTESLQNVTSQLPKK